MKQIFHQKNREKNLSVDSAEWNTTKSIWCKNLESLAGLTFRLFVKGVHDHAKNAWPWNLVNIERVPEEQKLARRSPCWTQERQPFCVISGWFQFNVFWLQHALVKFSGDSFLYPWHLSKLNSSTFSRCTAFTQVYQHFIVDEKSRVLLHKFLTGCLTDFSRSGFKFYKQARKNPTKMLKVTAPSRDQVENVSAT